MADLTTSATIDGFMAAANAAAARTAIGAGAGDALTASTLAQFAATTSAELAGVISNETGSGSLVFGTAPTISAPVITGIAVYDGARVNTANALGAFAIDVTKGLNTKTIAADQTFTFSGTPANTNQIFSLAVTNSDSSSHTLTIPSSFSEGQGAAITTVAIAASSKVTLTWRYDGSVYNIYGDPVLTTGTGAYVRATSPTLVTPALGTPSAIVLTNATAVPAGQVVGVIPIANLATGTPTGSKFIRDDGTLQTIAGGGDALTSNPLSQFAATTSLQLKGVISDETGSGALVFATSPTLVTPVLGTPASGNLSSCTADGTNAVGFLQVPQNSQSAAYTTVLADAGKHIYHPGADTTARTMTIDSNANVAYPVGTTLTFVNDTSAGVMTIAITSDTMILAGAGTTGSRTLAANGIATALKMTSTRWIINGTGLT